MSAPTQPNNPSFAQLLLELEHLRRENEHLRRENERLHEENARLSNDVTEGLDDLVLARAEITSLQTDVMVAHRAAEVGRSARVEVAALRQVLWDAPSDAIIFAELANTGGQPAMLNLDVHQPMEWFWQVVAYM
jgi:hypothetical protein